ncbi:hypothetical protein ACFQPF_15690 [Fictibacillus iocasae]|uniref:B box-type domain-containing protein n=1 Tax=Fictibacillus iocasae TaxID=2715437 RepID=A0ABW2NR88_9BACL
MKCYKHYEMDAVSTCTVCGKALCPNCSEKFTYPSCDSCVLNQVSEQKSILIRNAIIMTVLFAFGLTEGFMLAIALAGVPWGWSALNKITPNIFLFMPLMGWVIYFLIKLGLSMVIGVFVLPFQVMKIVKGLKEAKQLAEYTNAA